MWWKQIRIKVNDTKNTSETPYVPINDEQIEDLKGLRQKLEGISKWRMAQWQHESVW